MGILLFFCKYSHIRPSRLGLLKTEGFRTENAKKVENRPRAVFCWPEGFPIDILGILANWVWWF